MLVALEVTAAAWAQEFIAALPTRWRDYFGEKRWLVISGDRPLPLLPRDNTRPIAIVIPASEFLMRQIEFPLLAGFQLANLMRFEAPGHVPQPLDQVKLDFRIVRRDVAASRMLVELAIIRKEAVEAARQQAHNLGVNPDALLLSTSHGLWFARRPLDRQLRQAWQNRRYQSLALRVAVPALLALAWALAAQSWTSRFASSRDAAVIAAQSQAAGIGPLRQQLSALDDKLVFLADTRARASSAAVAEEVARLLPDNAWLQELDIEDQDVRLLGTAQHATNLLGVFSGSPLFGNVQFEAPLTQASAGTGEQFDIMMTRD